MSQRPVENARRYVWLSEPVAAVGNPPGSEHDGNCGEEGPPERQQEVGEQAEDRERSPEDLLLHESIVGA